MNTHQNARLTVWGRAEAVRRLLQDGEPVALVAAALHVSPWTLYKWRRRFLTEGPPGLLDRSSRPHHSPQRTAARLVRRMLHLRTTRRLTGPEIAAALRLPRATVGRWLRHAGLGRLKQPGSEQPRPRYQREHPGERAPATPLSQPDFRNNLMRNDS